MKVGKVTQLKVIEIGAEGYDLIGADGKKVFLNFEKEAGPFKKGESVEVFSYKTPKFVVTALKPLIQLEEFGFLKVIETSDGGAWVDWGLKEHLFVPIDEQLEELMVGSSYLFFVFQEEETGRFLGSQRVDDFVFFDEIDISRGSEVKLLPYRESPLGINAVVNNLYKGLVFRSDIHKTIELGKEIKGYVKQVREDGHIDLLLEPMGYKGSIDGLKTKILKHLSDNDGFVKLNDKSDAALIKAQLGMSKKAFKRALGSLYKQRKIEFKDQGISLK